MRLPPTAWHHCSSGSSGCGTRRSPRSRRMCRREPAMTDRVPPVRRQLVVPASPEAAFDAFTQDIGAWWPLQKSVYGEASSVSFTGGRLVEESSDGSAVWGTVLDWSPPDGFRMTWHPGYLDETVAT